MSLRAQSRDRFLARLEGTMGGEQPRPTRGTVSVGGTGWRIDERVQKVDIGILGWDEVRNINTARSACRTIQRVRNVPRQPETFYCAPE